METEHSVAGRTQRFFSNVAWSWLAVGATLFSAVFVSPYIVRKLGSDAFGIWTLLFATIGYYFLSGVGVRSAVVKYCTHYRVIGNPQQINEVLNTGFASQSLSGLLLLLATLALAPFLDRIFQLPPAYHSVFTSLFVLLGGTLTVGMPLGVFGAGLEAFQRFDIASRLRIPITLVRAFGSVLVLLLGYGLLAMGLVFVATQFWWFVLLVRRFRRVFPEHRFSLRLAKFSVWRQMAGYGFGTLLSNVASLTLNRGVPVLIGHYLPVAFVGYYNLPQRMLQYTVDAVSRVGVISGANAAELHAKGDREGIIRLAVHANRYCLTLFLPVAIMFLVYGYPLIHVWISPGFAAHSAPLLAALVTSTTIATAGQFNSSAILYGLARHRPYGVGMLTEAVLSVAGLALVLPRYGILGAAWLLAVLSVLNRGLLAPWLLCRSLKFGFFSFMGLIYARPLLTAAPALALAWGLRRTWAPGNTWPELLAAGLLVSAAHLGAAYFICFQPAHRKAAAAWFNHRLAGALRLVRFRLG